MSIKSHTMSSFEKWIDEKEWDLLHIRERLGLLKALEATLGEQIVAGKVQVKNHAVYRVAMDSYEMLVVNLSSFFSGLIKSGPGLNQVNNYLSKLALGKEPKGQPKTYEERDELDIKKLNYGYRVTAFARLFPECESGKPTQDDVQKMKDHLAERSKRCRELRNAIHAHRYEQKKQNAEPLEAMKLSEIEDLLIEAQHTLNALRLLVLNSTFGYGDVRELKETAEETAMDLREIILHGSFNNFCFKLGTGDGSDASPWYWQRRNTFYSSEAWFEERDSWDFSREE